MQDKVDLLIFLVEEFRKRINEFGLNKLSQNLTEANFCLKYHDLIGIDIIKNTLGNNELNKNCMNEEFDRIRKQIFCLIYEIKQDFQRDVIPISESEHIFLNLSYNKFFDIFSEVFAKDFWKKDSYYRFSKISQTFSIYNEVINHEPFDGVFKWLEKYRPPMESEISGPLFKFIRNVLVHFPFFEKWDDIWFNKKLINWNKPNQSIDKFLEKYCGKPQVEYRFKENPQPGFTYVTIKFPKEYSDEKIFLKDIICEEEGFKFVLIMMLRVLNTQIESINEK
jgi:hypothetical protein